MALFVFGLLLALGGVALTCAFFMHGGWWTLVGGIVLSAGACWLTWVSIFGKKTTVDKVVSDFITNLFSGFC